AACRAAGRPTRAPPRSRPGPGPRRTGRRPACCAGRRSARSPRRRARRTPRRTRTGSAAGAARRPVAPRPPLARHPVPGAADGLDDLAAQLATQVAHVDLDDVDVLAGPVPDVVAQLDLADDAIGVVHEVLQERQLAGGER